MNSAPTNIGVVNFMNSEPTLTPVSFSTESNPARYLRVMYANFIPCSPSFAIMAAAAPANGTIPIARTSSSSMSNWMAMMAMGMSVTGTTASLQFIAKNPGNGNI